MSSREASLTTSLELLFKFISKGDAVIFVGSNFLEPPRYRYVGAIIDIRKGIGPEEEKERNRTVDKDIEVLTTIDTNLQMAYEFLGNVSFLKLPESTQLRFIEYAKKTISMAFEAIYPTGSIKKIIEGDRDETSKEKMKTTTKKERRQRDVEKLKHEIDKLRSEVRRAIIDLEEKVRPTTTKEAHLQLHNYLESIWPPYMNENPLILLRNIGKVTCILTTIFDTNIEYAANIIGKKLSVITGIDSIYDFSREKMKKIKENLILYKLLGSIDRPETLRISTELSTKDSLSALSDEFRRAKHPFEFLNDVIKDKVLILLGYEDSDIYDRFFRKLINDSYYTLGKSFIKKIYFINEFNERTYLGIWGDKDESDIRIMPLTPKNFVRSLAGGVDRATTTE